MQEFASAHCRVHNAADEILRFQKPVEEEIVSEIWKSKLWCSYLEGARTVAKVVYRRFAPSLGPPRDAKMTGIPFVSGGTKF